MPRKPRVATPRESILTSAIAHTCGDRDKQYGTPATNLGNTADLWTTYLIAKYRGQTLDEVQFRITAEDVAWLNNLQKISRSFSGVVNPDNYEDAAAYSAIAGECAIDAISDN